MTAFFDRISYPVLTDLRLTMPSGQPYDVYPRDLGHLYRGDQLLVVGRYRGEGPGQVVLEGRLGGETALRQLTYAVSFPTSEPRNEFLPRVWAVRKVGTLLDDIRHHGEQPELREEVVQLATRFGIVTPYTSYLVAPDEPMPVQPPVLAMPTDGVQLQLDRRAGRMPTTEAAPSYAASGADASSVAGDFASFPGAVAQAAPPRTSSSTGSSSSAPSAPSYATSTPSYSPPTPAPPAGPDATGEAGRRLSSRLREMRSAERADEAEASTVRIVGTRTFTLTAGRWVDGGFHAGGRVLRVRPMSAAYFALIAARPELRAAFALGDAVVVALDGGRAIEVAADAAEVSADEARRFVEGS
jgi:Ca-activated chloride channel family protein